MIYPSIAELTKNHGINRYTLVIATAKCARIITDEYVRQREYAEKLTMSKDSEKGKSIANLIKREYRDDKAVKLAVNGLYNNEFRILSDEEAEELHRKEKLAAEAEAAAKKAAEESAKAAAASGESVVETVDEDTQTAGETQPEAEESDSQPFDADTEAETAE